MKTVKIILLLNCLLVLNRPVCSQTNEDTLLIRIETKDGNEYIGQIIKEEPAQILMSTKNIGEIAIQKSDIKTREIVQPQQIKNGEIWLANPQATRYFWAPNGFGLNEGEGYYQNIWVLWNQFAYGLTDNFSIGGAVVPLFLFGGAPTPAFITAKFSIPLKKEKVNLGLGAIAGTVIGETGNGFGIVYGLSTFGTSNNNISIGLGYGFSEGELASSPLINISGMLRLSARWYLLTENYFVSADGESFAMMSLGGRWIINKAALDFGLVSPVEQGIGFIGIPWLGFTIPFGNTK